MDLSQKNKPRSSRRRRNEAPIQFRVDAVELELIKKNASACSMTTSEFLRKLGIGFIPSSKLDQIHVRELCAAVGNLGRMGGLLKLWLLEHRAGSVPQTLTTPNEVDALYQDIVSITTKIKAKVLEL
jgi:hypothetical protein